MMAKLLGPYLLRPLCHPAYSQETLIKFHPPYLHIHLFICIFVCVLSISIFWTHIDCGIGIQSWNQDRELYVHNFLNFIYLFFLRLSCIFTFLGIICQKCCVSSSIFNINMAAQKFTNFDKFFKCTLIWQLSQYNLTKLFQMKLKTTKHYYSHCTEKT